MKPKNDQTVTFTFSFPTSVKQVYLVGDFNSWQIGQDPMVRLLDGKFRRTKKLPPGRHQYKFYADGLFWDDPQAAEHTNNSFGTQNAVVTVG